MVSFKAGTMHASKVDGGPKVRVTADKRKGLVALVKVSPTQASKQQAKQEATSPRVTCPNTPCRARMVLSTFNGVSVAAPPQS